jgi:SPX domain protein involved in polyphosphate accumulation
MTDNVQHQRLELKYIIREQTALRVRDFVSSYLYLDKFGAGKPDFSYPIYSLYLDSDPMVFYWHSVNGNKNRYKLRVRYYDENPASAIFFEIKRRMNDAILKQRGAVKRGAVADLLAGKPLQPEQLLFDETEQFKAVENFCRLAQYHSAKPKAHVVYRREAWIGPHDNSVRVTLDRDVCLAPEATSELSTTVKNPVPVFAADEVVLELKFTGRFPDWFADLVRYFNLRQCSAAKYADGVALVMKSGKEFSEGAVPPFPGSGEKFRPHRDFFNEIQPATQMEWK